MRRPAPTCRPRPVMIELAATADLLRARIPDLARQLAARLPLGSPQSEVVGDLRFLLEIFATGMELGSCGLVDRTLAWQKVRTRALGGDADALSRLPGVVAELLAPTLDAAQRDAVARLLDNAATFVRFAPAEAATGRDPLLQPGGIGHEFLVAASAGDRRDRDHLHHRAAGAQRPRHGRGDPRRTGPRPLRRAARRPPGPRRPATADAARRGRRRVRRPAAGDHAARLVGAATAGGGLTGSDEHSAPSSRPRAGRRGLS